MVFERWWLKWSSDPGLQDPRAHTPPLKTVSLEGRITWFISKKLDYVHREKIQCLHGIESGRGRGCFPLTPSCHVEINKANEMESCVINGYWVRRKKNTVDGWWYFTQLVRRENLPREIGSQWDYRWGVGSFKWRWFEMKAVSGNACFWLRVCK